MHLIDTTTLQLEEFLGGPQLKYAILSHRWEEEEVSFQDMSSERAREKKGYSKIQSCCQKAAIDGYSYAWIDTCCIDKSSSAALTEAINSMFQWYQDAGKCYAYISDLRWDSSSRSTEAFEKSVWFTRGWTLQELIAPRNIAFYDCDWEYVGDKSDLLKVIQRVTEIDPLVLERRIPLSRVPVAAKMSWASKRTTSRVEDIAYCLMGLFNVNMPLLYGEGKKAFTRLQEEIIKQNDDQTIFVWSGVKKGQPGLLAPSPASFAGLGDVQLSLRDRIRLPFSMTNRGLSITFKLLPWAMHTYVALLPCTCPRFDMVGVFLKRLTEDDQYARVVVPQNGVVRGGDLMHSQNLWRFAGAEHLLRNKAAMKDRSIYVRQGIVSSEDEDYHEESPYGFALDEFYFDHTPIEFTGLGFLADARGLFTINQRMVGQSLTRKYRFFELPPGKCGAVCILRPDFGRGDVGWIVLGFDWDFNPICFLVETSMAEKFHGSDTDSISWAKRDDTLWKISCFTNSRWSTIIDGIAQRAEKDPDVQGAPGIYALKGDRMESLRVSTISPETEVSIFRERVQAYYRPWESQEARRQPWYYFFEFRQWDS